jgi:hypothetical protein
MQWKILAYVFYEHLEYFTAIWYNLWPFGIVCVHLVHFSGFGSMHQETSGNPDLGEVFCTLRFFASVATVLRGKRCRRRRQLVFLYISKKVFCDFCFSLKLLLPFFRVALIHSPGSIAMSTSNGTEDRGF